MLPLEAILFIPSLIVTPLVLAAAYFWRRTESYRRGWQIAVVVSFLFVGLFTVQVLSTPMYSQRDGSPDNPGGFSVGLFEVLAVYLVMTCLVIPAFPVLIGLAFLPPRNWQGKGRTFLILACLLYVGIASLLVIQKHVRYVADYRQTKQQERSQGDQFRHLRVQ